MTPNAEERIAIALLVSTRGGLAVNYGGIHRFDLAETELEKVITEVANVDFKWRKPEIGRLRTALSIHVDKPLMTLIFVLDPCLNAEFAENPVIPGNAESKTAIREVRLWDSKDEGAGPRVMSLTADSSDLPHDCYVKFNLAVENVGELDGQPYRTPIFIDPDWPHPPTNGGVGGGGPP